MLTSSAANAGAVALVGAAFGQGSGEIILNDVECSGTENSLASCASNGLGVNNCNHFEDAGIRCNGKFQTNCFSPGG